MNLDSLKSQILAMSAVKGDDISSMIKSFLLISLVEHLFGFLPMFKDLINVIIKKYTDALKSKVTTVTIQKLDRPLLSRISYLRSYKSENIAANSSNQSNQNQNVNEFETQDCLLELAMSMDNTKHLVCSKISYVRHNEIIELTPKVNMQVVKLTENVGSGQIELIEFDLFSYEYTLSELQTFVRKVVQNSRVKRQNRLGNDLYFFNEVVKGLPKFNNQVDYGMAPKFISFTMSPFHTNKTLNNVYGESFALIKNRVDFFIKNEDWYKAKGIPYTLGILVHGPPGSGKTSCIKAIANSTKRHIINITLSTNSTKTQLKNLFFDDKLVIEKMNASTDNLTIPCDKRIYVIEDIDCLSDVVIDRDLKNKNFDERLIDIEKELQWIRKSKSKSTVAKEKVKQLFEEKKSIMVLKNPDKSKHVELVDERINLSFLLNLFDGVLETPGRILIVSSNYPERIDKALIRPGRIDLNIRFGFCSADTVKEIVSKVYEIAIEDLDKYEFADNEYTPAEINQVLFNYIENKKKGIEQLLKENIKEKKQEEEPRDEVTSFLESTDSLDSLSSGIDESEFRSLLDYQEEESEEESKEEEKVQKRKKKTKIIEKLLEAVDESSDEESE